MEQKSKKKKIPTKEEDYKVNYVFKADSIVDVNNVIKKCFLMKLNKTKI